MRNLVLLSSTFFILLSFVATAQHSDAVRSKDWLGKINANAINKPTRPNAFMAAHPGYALYFTKVGEMSVPYLVYVPKNYSPSNSCPMVVFLHGAILAKEDFQYKDPAIADEPIFSIGDTYNTIVVFPFGKSGFMWPAQLAAKENILEIVKDVQARYNIDKRKIFLGGISMGGISTFWFISNKPDVFAGFYAFSAMPRLSDGAVKFSNITKDKPLYSMNAKDDPGFSFNEVREIYEQHKQEAPGWHFGSVETGGHRFIYANGGKEIVKGLLGNLLKP